MKNNQKIKLIVILLTAIFFAVRTNGQGVILTQTGDTIRCSKIEPGPDAKYYWINDIKYKMPKNVTEYRNIDYSLTENETDAFTGELKKTSKYNVVSMSTRDVDGYEKPFVIYMKKIISLDSIIYVLYLRTSKDLGCSGAKGNYVMIKFKNNEVIKLEKDIADIDCARSSVSIYIIKNENLSKLRNNEIKSIRFQRSKYYEDFNILFPDYLIKTIELLDK